MNTIMMNQQRMKFFGSYVDPWTMVETLQRVEDIIRERTVTQHVVINVAKLVMMQKDPALREIVNSCPIINADGQGIVWGAKLLGLNIPERVAGIDLFLNLIKLAPQKGWKVYLFGAKQEIVDKVAQIFTAQHPGIQIVGRRNGYFKKEEERRIAEEIRASGADMLFVALSSPQKEIFLNQYVELMKVPFVMGVGGSFDVVAGFVQRAPLWMQNAGLEWFYRFMKEPGRMWKRYFTTNGLYLWMLLKAILTGKKKCGCEA